MINKRTNNLHWTERAGLFNFAIALCAIPINSDVSLLFLLLWSLTTALKNSLLKRWSFFIWHQDKTYIPDKQLFLVLPMLLYWGMYLLGMIWTENKTDGWREVGQTAWFTIVPLTCICTDFREVTKKYLRKIFWLYVLLMSLLFIELFVTFIFKKCGFVESTFLSFMTGPYPQFYYIHHSYMAVYILAGLAFLYSEWWSADELSVKKVSLMIICTCCLLFFLLFINSRTGTLGLILLLLMCWLHLFFVHRKYRVSIMAFVVVLAISSVLYIVLPDEYRRLTSTTEQVAQGDKSDLRFSIMGNALSVVKDNILVGVGTGDVIDALEPYYGDRESVSRPHNQYLETWVALGLPGFVSLLIMIFVPVLTSLKNRRFLLFSVLIIFSVSLMFESMLERHMGICFFCVIMLIHAIEAENDKNKKALNAQYMC